MRPACFGGLCITHYCFGCPHRFEYACKCGSCFCGNESYYCFDGEKMKGYGGKRWVRVGGGHVAPAGADAAPAGAEMAR